MTSWGWLQFVWVACLWSCGGFQLSSGVSAQHVVEPQGKTTMSAPLELAMHLGRDEGVVIGTDSSLDWLLKSSDDPQPKHDYYYSGFIGYAVHTPLRYLSNVGFEIDGGFGAGRAHIHDRYAPVVRPMLRMEMPIRPYCGDALWKSERILWPDIFIVPYLKATALIPTTGSDKHVVPQLGGGIWIRFHIWTALAP